MSLGEFLQKLCRMLKEMFFASFGDPEHSTSSTLTLPATTDWQLIATMTNPCLLILRNLDSTEEFEYAWKTEGIAQGILFPADTIIGLDNVSGTLYARPLDSSKTVQVNIGIISKRITDQ